MANVQKEHGYTKVANSILDALCHIRIPGEAYQVLNVILRQTYGYNQRSAMITLDKFAIMTGLKKSNVIRAIKKLVEMNLIIKKDNGKYVLQKDFDHWKVLSKKITIIKKDNLRYQKREQPLSKKIKSIVELKDTIKDTSKDNSELCATIIEYLNNKAQRHFDYHNKAHAKFIIARHQEGATIQLMKDVIDYKVWDWKTKHEKNGTIPSNDMSEYLRPSTLFNATKFANYVEATIRNKMQIEARKTNKSKYEKQQMNAQAKEEKIREESWSEVNKEINELKKKHGKSWFLHYNKEQK